MVIFQTYFFITLQTNSVVIMITSDYIHNQFNFWRMVYTIYCYIMFFMPVYKVGNTSYKLIESFKKTASWMAVYIHLDYLHLLPFGLASSRLGYIINSWWVVQGSRDWIFFVICDILKQNGLSPLLHISGVLLFRYIGGFI